ncbi:MAG: hypothetical protein NTW82_08315 [Bacteroidia bacterium]|nr:hypothetical protein [Bacteroidia bacterium]
MSKIINKIGVCFLWLAGLVLCAHLIIPHDHHISDASVIEDENCPASERESSHHQGLPDHCHAFNDLVSEKFRVYHILPDIQYNLNAFIRPSDENASDLPVYCVGIIDLQKPFIDSYALELSLLRAPPSLA